jgi:hypothetical protein
MLGGCESKTSRESKPIPNTFICFSKLPVELQDLVWEAVAYLPRNLDVWASFQGELRYQGENDFGPTEFVYRPFKFVTSQPPPAILYVNQEAHKIGLQRYELSFDVDYDPGCGFTFTTPTKIYQNWDMDRICPMGGVRREFSLIVLRRRASHSYAVNLFVKDPRNPTALSKIFGHNDGSPDELLLYYSKYETRHLGRFEFVEYDEDLTGMEETEKELLVSEKDRVLTEVAAWETREKLEDRNKYPRKGKEVPKGLDDWCLDRLDIKIVYIVVDGIKR